MLCGAEFQIYFASSTNVLDSRFENPVFNRAPFVMLLVIMSFSAAVFALIFSGDVESPLDVMEDSWGGAYLSLSNNTLGRKLKGKSG